MRREFAGFGFVIFGVGFPGEEAGGLGRWRRSLRRSWKDVWRGGNRGRRHGRRLLRGEQRAGQAEECKQGGFPQEELGMSEDVVLCFHDQLLIWYLFLFVSTVRWRQ